MLILIHNVVLLGPMGQTTYRAAVYPAYGKGVKIYILIYIK